jgi:hypothetical protein
MLLTDWNAFRALGFPRMKSLLRRSAVVDRAT